MATMKDVAARAEVSVTLVSRYINQKKGVGPESAKRIQEAIDELNYKPNALARSLVQGETKTIAVLLDNLCSSRMFPFIQGIEEVVHAAGYTVIFLSGAGDVRRKAQIFNEYSRGRVDGILVYGELEFDLREDDLRGTTQLPLTFVDSDITFFSGDHVKFDSAQGSYQLARHLLRDRRWVCLFTADKDSRETQNRMNGYARAVREVSDEDHMHMVESGWSEQEGYQTMIRLLSKGICPEAVMAASDDCACGVMKALVEFGKRIPEDVAVTGFGGDTPVADPRLPALTTIHQPLREIGKEAAKMLLLRISQPGLPLENRYFPSQLSLHRSSRSSVQGG